MAKGVVVCYWGPGHKTHGHIGMSVEADAGKTYITWVPTGASGQAGDIQGLQDDFRVMTGIKGDARNGISADARNRQLALGMGPLRPGQQRTNRLSNTLTKTPTAVQLGTQSYNFNYGQILKMPDLTCEIPAIDHAGGTQLGLDVDRIYHWWVSFGIAAQSLHASGGGLVPWKKVSTSRNCCSVVFRALSIGGASYYRSKWFKRCYLTPPEVWKYVTKLKTTIDELNRNNAAVVRSAAELGQKLHGLTVPGANAELPSMREWLTMSHVKAGVFTGKAARKEQILNIDSALADYWQEGPWPSDGDVSEAAVDVRDAKAYALCKIIGQAGTHAALKPKSDRKHAVAAILNRAWLVMRQRVRGNIDMKLWGEKRYADIYEAYESAYDRFAAEMTTDTFS